MSSLTEFVPARALAIYAHPDDADVSCGGTLARWADGGCQVHVVIATSGDKGSSDPGVDQSDLVDQRRDEAARALETLGVAGHHPLEIPDGDVTNDHPTRASLVGLIRDLRPDVVVGPDPTAVIFGSTYINHRDHRELGWAVLDAVAPAASSPLYFPGEGPAHVVAELWLSGTLEPDTFVDIESTLEKKVGAIACHVSQIGKPGEWLRDVVVERAKDAGRQVGVDAAEGFRRIVLG